MGNLLYRTRGNSSPQGKERVYFTCHPADFKAYFGPICEDIFKTQNCAIWYRKELEEEELVTAEGAEPMGKMDEELSFDLTQMQLFVIPITSRFLHEPNNARDLEFRFAVDHHIPILPLMQEHGLEDDFNKICGDLQFLEKDSGDETAIDYRTKLKNFLESVLVGDELAAKIRAAFDAYVFLSYRKKDRKYAQELMRLIHKNDFCRDIAIWYDEFLVPGENFNDAILEALRKSNLFALLVTPNLVNEKNYVMTVEYPMARQEGKTVLPAEVVPTSRASLTENYDGIPECTDAHDEEALSEALKRNLQSIAIRENDGDPQHLFFIGLAYLSGIDVEVDTQKAVELLREAADLGLGEAARKLADMYHAGLGVERDYETCLFWMEKYAESLQRSMEETGDPEIGDELWKVLYGIVGDWYNVRQPERAEAACKKLLDVLVQMSDRFGEMLYQIVNDALLPRKYAYAIEMGRCYSVLIEICEAQEKIDEAFAWQTRAADYFESFYQSSMTELAERFREDEDTLADVEDMLWLELENIYESGIDRYERWEKDAEVQAWQLRKTEMEKKRLLVSDAASDSNSAEKYQGKDSWEKMSDEDFLLYFSTMPISQELKEHLESRIARLVEVCGRTREIKLRYTVAELYSAMWRIIRKEYNEEEKKYNLAKRDLLGDVPECERTWRKDFNRLLAVYQEYLDCQRKAAEGGEDAEQWKKKEGELEQQVSEAKKQSDESFQKLEEAEQRVDEEQMAKLESEWEQKNLEKKSREQLDIWDEKLRLWNEKTLELLLEYVNQVDREYEENPSEETETEKIDTYGRIADLYRRADDSANAGRWYRKKLELVERRYSQTHDIGHYYEIAETCYALGMLDEEHPDVQMLRRALAIRKELYRYLPDPYEAEEIEELEKACQSSIPAVK